MRIVGIILQVAPPIVIALAMVALVVAVHRGLKLIRTEIVATREALIEDGQQE